MILTGLPMVEGVDPWNQETAQQLPWGAIGYDRFGNQYRYVQGNLSAALVTGNLIQSVPQPANFVDLAVAVAAPTFTKAQNASYYNNQVTLTLSGTPVTANQFVGGRAVVSVTPGIGNQYTILSHQVQATTSASCYFNFEENLQTALTTSSKMTVTPHPYNGVVQSPTSPTGFSAGVAVYPLSQNTSTQGYWGWVATKGVFGVLSDATTGAVGNGMSPSTTTAGCVTKAVTLKDSIGYIINTPTSAEVEPQWLNIN